MEIVSYFGQKVFVGIDVHLRQYTVTCRNAGAIVKRCTMAAEPARLVGFIEKYFAGAQVYTAYEAGFSGYGLHRYLEKRGIFSIVVHAASIEVSKKKVKTDKRDSKRIAEQLEGGRLHGIRVPTEAEEQRRVLNRTREQLVRAHTRVLNQMRMKFHQFGLLSFDERRRMSPMLAKEALARVEAPELRCAIECLLRMRESIQAQVVFLNQKLKEQAKCNAFDATYRQLPGFGVSGARILSNELGDMSQFSNEKRLFSFTGLTPSEDTSDEARHLGRITRQGPARIRHVLIEAAWRAIKKDAGLKEVFDKIAAKAGKKKAIVAIARRLAGRARALFRKKEDYKRDLKFAA